MSKKRDRTRQGQEEIGPTEAEAMLFRLAHKVDKLKDEPWSPSKKRSKLTHLTSEGDERDGASTEEYRGVTDGSKTVEIDGSKIVEIDGSIDNKEGPSPDADSGLDLAMAPTSALRSCDGFDIVRKGGRGRGRQLMVLPGMLGLGAAGGRIGTLKDVTSASPTLYVEFPEGRLKCTGRTIYTKGRFFSTYADKAGKRATRMECRDVFDSILFFSRAYWVGKKEDNPEEGPMLLPERLQSLPEESTESAPKEIKTHFGGGNPESLLPHSANDASNLDPVEKDMKSEDVPEGEACQHGEDGGSERASSTPSRRSGRTRTSTVSYVEKSDESNAGDESDGSSSSGDSSGSGSSRGKAGVKNVGGDIRGKKQPQSRATPKEEQEDKDEEDEVSEKEEGVKLSLERGGSASNRVPKKNLGAAGAKKPETTPTATPISKKGSRGRSKKSPAASGAASVSKTSARCDDAEDGEEWEGGSSSSLKGEEIDGAGSATASQPSRRSRRSSAGACVKYTQSSSESEEVQEEDDDDDGKESEEQDEDEDGEWDG